MTTPLLTVLTFILETALAHAQTASTPLKAGDSIPDVTLRTEDEKEVSLRKLASEKPAVFVFYRGGWCPFCNRGKIRFAHVDPDYKVRLNPSKIVEAARAAKK